MQPQDQIKKIAASIISQTTSLKEKVIEATKDRVIREYNTATILSNRSIEDWCSILGLTPKMVNVISGASNLTCKRIVFPTSFANSEEGAKLRRIVKQAKVTVSGPLQDNINYGIERAEKRYIFSVERLAYVLHKKGFNPDTIEVKTEIGMGENIELVVSDGVKIVMSRTILAWGPKNVPHFRFLVR